MAEDPELGRAGRLQVALIVGRGRDRGAAGGHVPVERRHVVVVVDVVDDVDRQLGQQLGRGEFRRPRCQGARFGRAGRGPQTKIDVGRKVLTIADRLGHLSRRTQIGLGVRQPHFGRIPVIGERTIQVHRTQNPGQRLLAVEVEITPAHRRIEVVSLGAGHIRVIGRKGRGHKGVAGVRVHPGRAAGEVDIVADRRHPEALEGIGRETQRSQPGRVAAEYPGVTVGKLRTEDRMHRIARGHVLGVQRNHFARRERLGVGPVLGRRGRGCLERVQVRVVQHRVIQAFRVDRHRLAIGPAVPVAIVYGIRRQRREGSARRGQRCLRAVDREHFVGNLAVRITAAGQLPGLRGQLGHAAIEIDRGVELRQMATRRVVVQKFVGIRRKPFGERADRRVGRRGRHGRAAITAHRVQAAGKQSTGVVGIAVQDVAKVHLPRAPVLVGAVREAVGLDAVAKVTGGVQVDPAVQIGDQQGDQRFVALAPPVGNRQVHVHPEAVVLHDAAGLVFQVLDIAEGAVGIGLRERERCGMLVRPGSEGQILADLVGPVRIGLVQRSEETRTGSGPMERRQNHPAGLRIDDGQVRVVLVGRGVVGVDGPVEIVGAAGGIGEVNRRGRGADNAEATLGTGKLRITNEAIGRSIRHAIDQIDRKVLVVQHPVIRRTGGDPQIGRDRIGDQVVAFATDARIGERVRSRGVLAVHQTGKTPAPGGLVHTGGIVGIIIQNVRHHLLHQHVGLGRRVPLPVHGFAGQPGACGKTLRGDQEREAEDREQGQERHHDDRHSAASLQGGRRCVPHDQISGTE